MKQTEIYYKSQVARLKTENIKLRVQLSQYQKRIVQIQLQLTNLLQEEIKNKNNKIQCEQKIFERICNRISNTQLSALSRTQDNLSYLQHIESENIFLKKQLAKLKKINSILIKKFSKSSSPNIIPNPSSSLYSCYSHSYLPQNSESLHHYFTAVDYLSQQVSELKNEREDQEKIVRGLQLKIDRIQRKEKMERSRSKTNIGMTKCSRRKLTKFGLNKDNSYILDFGQHNINEAKLSKSNCNQLISPQNSTHSFCKQSTNFKSQTNYTDQMIDPQINSSDLKTSGFFQQPQQQSYQINKNYSDRMTLPIKSLQIKNDKKFNLDFHQLKQKRNK